MKRAGIKVWVLTGDKVGTAKMIGLSTGLLEPAMKKYEIRNSEGGKAPGFNEQLEDILKASGEIAASNDKYKAGGNIAKIQTQGIIVDGASLVSIDADEKLREKFVAAAILCDVVLACRVSPKQKADVVNMIKLRFPEKTTLAIGDGANDVA